MNILHTLSFITLLQLSNTRAFRCPDSSKSHPQSQFCSSDFVVKATIQRRNKTLSTSELSVFDMSLRTELKLPSAFLKRPIEEVNRLYIPSNQESMVTAGAKYLVSGRAEKDGIYSDLCNDWVQPWEEVAHRHKSHLRKGTFGKACQCEASVGGNQPSCEKRVDKDQASITSNRDQTLSTLDLLWHCYAKHALCLPNAKSGTCQWSHSRELKACKAVAGKT